MTNKGIVTAVSGDELTVIFERHEACGDCHACMHGSTDCAKHTITIRGQADVGDEIVVEMDESHVMAAAYLIPFAGLAAGLAMGWLLGRAVTGINSELLMALTGVAGTAIAYVIMRALDPKLSRGRWEPRIVSVTPPEADIDNQDKE